MLSSWLDATARTDARSRVRRRRGGRRGAPKRHPRTPGKVRTSHFGLGPATASEALTAGLEQARIEVSTRRGRVKAVSSSFNRASVPALSSVARPRLDSSPLDAFRW